MSDRATVPASENLAPLPASVDTVVIGAGIVGLATGMALGERNPSLLVVDAEADVARHQTGNNSGVIHSGLYYKPGSLKATLCTQGRLALVEFAREHGIPFDTCGKLVVALDDDERIRLDELVRRGTANGLADLRVMSMQEAREIEPHVAGVAAIRVRETGIINYREVSRVYRKVIESRGGTVALRAGVARVDIRADELVVHTARGSVRARHLVNCAGLQSDRVARMCGLNPATKIVGFRGEYYDLRPEAHRLCRHLIYPVPDPRFPFLGVHFTRMIGGGVEAGPNAVLALARHGYRWRDVSLRDLAETFAFPGFRKMALRYWKMGLGEMHRSVSKRAFVAALRRLVPEITDADLTRGGAGVRAQAIQPDGSMVDDFVIEMAPRMFHVLNAPSPAATASIAIGRQIARAAESHFVHRPIHLAA